MRLFFILVLTLACFSATTHSASVGNIQIVAGDLSPSHNNQLEVKLDGVSVAVLQPDFGSLNLWSISTGEHSLAVTDQSDSTTTSCSLTVYPGLTSRVRITGIETGRMIEFEGIVDQSAPMLTIDSRMLGNLPGELGDGVGLFATDASTATQYNWEGLPYRSTGWTWDQKPSLTDAPIAALVNLGDPFAGYDKADISLFARSDSFGFENLQGTYGTRDQRFFRGNSNTPLFCNKAVLAISFVGENSADAAPRWNVDSILPHNGNGNNEATLKFRYDDNTRSTFDLVFMEKQTERNYYLQPYHFDYIHSPKEKTLLLRGAADYQFKLGPDLFFTAGAGWWLDDRKFGDGVYFDDAHSYLRRVPADPSITLPNYGTQYDGVFWSWDDLHGTVDTIWDYSGDSMIVSNIDQGHYYEQYRRDKQTGLGFNLGAQKTLFGSASISAKIDYRMSKVRRYLNNYPSLGAYYSGIGDILGFDSLGTNSADLGLGTAAPAPKELRATLEGQQIGGNSFVKVALDLLRFDPGSQAIRNLLDPFGIGSSGDTGLDPSDLRNADISTKLGYRIAAGKHLTHGLEIIGSQWLTFQMPDYNYLYGGFSHIYAMVQAGGYEVFSNPDLKPIRRRESRVGLKASGPKGVLMASIFNRRISGLPVPWHISASIPRSYDIYQTSTARVDEERVTGMSVTAQGHVRDFLSGLLAATYTHGHHPVDSSYNWQIAWADPYLQGQTDFPIYDEFQGGVSLACDFSRLSTLSHSALGRIVRNCSVILTGNYKTGFHYIPTSIGSEIDLRRLTQPYLMGHLNKAGDFIECNLGIAAKVIERKPFHVLLRFEVLNLFNRANILGVYTGTGSPTDDGWLATPDGQNFIAETQTPSNNAQLTGEQAYRLALNDPNHFSRPRMVRISATLEF
jgi:hypothetical protein